MNTKQDYHRGQAVQVEGFFPLCAAFGFIGNTCEWRMGFTKKHAAKRMFAVMDASPDPKRYVSREDVA